MDDSSDEDDDTDVKDAGPRINSIMSQNRDNNVVKVNRSVTKEDDLALVDSGADTCLMGSDFHIESNSGRAINLEGFGGEDTVIKDMQICTRITLAMDRMDKP